MKLVLDPGENPFRNTVDGIVFWTDADGRQIARNWTRPNWPASTDQVNEVAVVRSAKTCWDWHLTSADRSTWQAANPGGSTALKFFQETRSAIGAGDGSLVCSGTSNVILPAPTFSQLVWVPQSGVLVGSTSSPGVVGAHLKFFAGVSSTSGSLAVDRDVRQIGVESYVSGFRDWSSMVQDRFAGQDFGNRNLRVRAQFWLPSSPSFRQGDSVDLLANPGNRFAIAGWTPSPGRIAHGIALQGLAVYAEKPFGQTYTVTVTRLTGPGNTVSVAPPAAFINNQVWLWARSCTALGASTWRVRFSFPGLPNHDLTVPLTITP